jgi:uncharacterized membrane protein YeiH
MPWRARARTHHVAQRDGVVVSRCTLLPLIHTLDLLGVAVFAASGALLAGRKRLDLFGVAVIALVTAVGGGTLRDLLLGATPVFWVRHPIYVLVALLTVIAVLLGGDRLGPRRGALLVADACGLALFSVLGAREALRADVSPAIAVAMGVMTGVAGGLMRDVLCGEIPLILRQEVYATAALTAAGVFVGLSALGVGGEVPLWLGILAGLTLRLAAIRWGFSLPIFSLRE